MKRQAGYKLFARVPAVLAAALGPLQDIVAQLGRGCRLCGKAIEGLAAQNLDSVQLMHVKVHKSRDVVEKGICE
jgi:hypothetical protein